MPDMFRFCKILARNAWQFDCGKGNNNNLILVMMSAADTATAGYSLFGLDHGADEEDSLDLGVGPREHTSLVDHTEDGGGPQSMQQVGSARQTGRHATDDGNEVLPRQFEVAPFTLLHFAHHWALEQTTQNLLLQFQHYYIIVLTSTVISSSIEASDFSQSIKYYEPQKHTGKRKCVLFYRKSFGLIGVSCYLCQYRFFRVAGKK